MVRPWLKFYFKWKNGLGIHLLQRSRPVSSSLGEGETQAIEMRSRKSFFTTLLKRLSAPKGSPPEIRSCELHPDL